MASIRHKAVLDHLSGNVGNDKTVEEAMIKQGYSESYAKSGHIKDTKTWEQLMEDYIPDSELAKVHQEGLKATKANGKPEYFARHKYLDSAYKLKKRYDNTITIKGKLSGLSDDEIEARIAGIVSGVIGAIAGEGKKNSA